MEKGDETQHGCERPSKGYRPFLLVVLFGSLYLSYLILRPFMETLIFAIVLSSMFYPLQIYLARHYGGRKTLAALTIVFIFTFLIALPVFFFVSALVSQGVDSVNQVNEWLKAGNLHKLTQHPKVLAYVAWLQERLGFLDLEKMDIPSTLLQLSKTVGQFLLSKGATILGNVATLIMHFAVMVFVIFYLVRDGDEMIERGRYYSPLRRDQEDRILSGVRVVARSVLLGSFLTALLQGLVGGIGLTLVGIQGLFWGTVMGFSSLIPVVGTSLVWIPTVIYLLLLGKSYSALFLTLWSIILVGSIDNFLRPFFMRGQGGMSPFYIFLAIIGGVQYYGLAGILYGPLILSFAMVMLYIYGAEYREDLLSGNKEPPPVEKTEGAERRDLNHSGPQMNADER